MKRKKDTPAAAVPAKVENVGAVANPPDAQPSTSTGGATGGGDADEKADLRELGATPRPPAKFTKKTNDANDVAKEVITTLLKQDETDAIDDAFQSHAKRMRRALTAEDVDDCLDEINSVVSRYCLSLIHI